MKTTQRPENVTLLSDIFWPVWDPLLYGHLFRRTRTRWSWLNMPKSTSDIKAIEAQLYKANITLKILQVYVMSPLKEIISHA